MSKITTKLVLIFMIFIASLSSSTSTLAAPKEELIEIIITNQVEPLKSDSTKKRLRIVDHSGLILIPKVAKVEIAKVVIKDTPKIEEKKVAENKAETKKEEVEPKPKIAPEVESKKMVKPEAKPENPKIVATPEPSKTVAVRAKNPETDTQNKPSTVDKNDALSKDAVQDLIRKYAQKYNQNPESMLKLADCESRFKVDLVTLGRYFGVYQFSKPTFEQYAKELDIQDPDPLNPEQNIEVAIYMIQNDQIGRWGCKV